jgi:hypothetical protein
MSFDVVSGIGGSNFAPLDRTNAISQPNAVTASSELPTSQTSQAGAAQATGTSVSAINPPKAAQPFLLVPTEPLTPAVLAELVGRQAPLSGQG